MSHDIDHYLQKRKMSVLDNQKTAMMYLAKEQGKPAIPTSGFYM